MTKIKTPKVKKEVYVEETPKKVNKKSVGEYDVYVKLNEKEISEKTDDIKSVLLAVKPDLLKTSLTIKVTKNGKIFERYLYLNDARRLFRNDLTLGIFVRDAIYYFN